MSATGSASSILLITTSSGTSRAPISASTARTAASCACGSASEPSTTCRIRSASFASSRVDRKASTSWCGRCRTNPTVSVSVNGRPPGVSAFRTVGSRVANSASSTSTPAPVSALSRLDLPALVYPAITTDGTSFRRRWPRCTSRPILNVGDLAAQLRDPRPDPAPVGLDLGLTGTAGPDAAAAGHPAAGLPGQRLAPASQPRHHVLQLGQLDLRLALAALGVLREDVQDQRGAVDHLDLDHALKAAQLARAELAVADHRVRAGRGHDPGELVRLARAHVGGGVDPAPALDQAVEHHGARGLGEPAELRQGVLRAGQRALGPHADQHDALEAQGPVLNLGDVGELGGKPRHAAQRVPVFQVKIPRSGVHLGALTKARAL